MISTLKIGKVYTFHGDFNFGNRITGVLNDMDDNFLKFVDCVHLKNNEKVVIVNIRNVCALYPEEL